MKVAVILLNYNSSSDCRKCVGFLKLQQEIILEIIIVDNCSRTDDREKVEALCREQGCTFIPANENRGYNAGNNVGLRYAASRGYDYALIANPDMEFPQTDYLYKLSKKIESAPSLAIVATDILTPEGRHQNPMREIGYWEELFWPVSAILNKKNSKWYVEDPFNSKFCEKVSGCCFIISLRFLKQIDFFDENVFLYSEESILAKEVARCGFKIFYDADLQAIHRHIKSQKGDPRRSIRYFRQSRLYYLDSYSGYSWLKLFLLKLSVKTEFFILQKYFDYKLGK